MMSKKIFASFVALAVVVAMAAGVMAADWAAFNNSGKGFIAEGITYTVVNEQGDKTVTLTIAEDAAAGTLLVRDSQSGKLVEEDFTVAGEYVFGPLAKGQWQYKWIPAVGCECVEFTASGYNDGSPVAVCNACGEEYPLEYQSATANAWVVRTNVNDLNVVVVETWVGVGIEFETEYIVSNVFRIANGNSAATYNVGATGVYVRVQGNVVAEFRVVE